MCRVTDTLVDDNFGSALTELSSATSPPNSRLARQNPITFSSTRHECHVQIQDLVASLCTQINMHKRPTFVKIQEIERADCPYVTWLKSS